MNLKQLIKFGLEESSVPIIKNPILRAALEPRSTVQEPRNMKLAKASPWDYTSNVNNPGLEQTEVLRNLHRRVRSVHHQPCSVVQGPWTLVQGQLLK